MRTTIDIDDDIITWLKEKSFKNGVSLKDVINDTLRTGMKAPQYGKKKYICPEFELGNPSNFDLDHALDIAQNLETEELVRKMHLRK